MFWEQTFNFKGGYAFLLKNIDPITCITSVKKKHCGQADNKKKYSSYLKVLNFGGKNIAVVSE